MKKSRFTDRTKWKIIIVLMVGMVVVALFLQAGILMYVNSKNLDKTSQMLLDQSISIIEKNQKNEIDLIRSMKEDYVIRARAVSYILESRLEAENDTEELQKIASLMSIDEIYLFDATGKIYSGTKQEYYGYSFDSGEQMEYFKPMLENKGLTMCQDITPNTSEGRSMMYAITWNSTGDKMIQVGIEPVRLLAEIKQNDVSTVVSNMPMYQGMNLYVADLDTHEILGATDENTIGKKLEAIGMPRAYLGGTKMVSGIVKIHGEKYNCVFEPLGEYLVGVTFAVSADNESNLIAILMVALYLCIACAILLYLVSRVLKANREKKEQYGILASMAEIYYRMYLVNLEQDSVIAYSDQTEEQETGKIYRNADQRMHEIMAETVIEAYQEQADQFVDLHTVAERMKGKKIISGEFVGKDFGWFRASFVTIRADINEKPVKAIFTIQSIENEKKKEEMLIETSNTDELTGCLNRRAYEKDIRGLRPSTEFVYVSMDVNGLKIVNDSLGHAAGDELLRGASYCIRKSFDDYGKVYRIGGDEFVAILFINSQWMQEIRHEFVETVESWKGERIDSMTISYGIVSSREKEWESVHEIAHAADIRMYEKKAMYYSRNGVDRRGQPAAYIALCKLYPKVLKINRNKDSYRILSWEPPKTEDGAPTSLSSWLEHLSAADRIVPEDKDEYLAKTDLDAIRRRFDETKAAQTITYHCEQDGKARTVTIEIVPTDEYTPENRTGFLYIKEHEKET